MTTRVGIELSPGWCRLVEIDARRPRAGTADTRVRSHASLAPGGSEFLDRLAAFRGHEAAVVVWGVRSVHHQVFVPERRYDDMRADALALAEDGGAKTAGMLADIAPSGASQKGNRPVLLAMAAADDLSIAVQPIIDAGLRLRTVTTPAGALASLARIRRDTSTPGAIEVYVALDERMTAVAFVRDGALIAARELPWGYLVDGTSTPTSAAAPPMARDAIVTRLIDEIGHLFSAIGAAPAALGQIVICGGLPELRSLAASMIERLDVEVEPLDSLFAIDLERLPEASDDLRERCAELRLAWAVVADWPTSINLLRYRQRQVVKARLARVAIAAGVAMGLGGGWLMARGGWLQSSGRVARAAVSRPSGQPPAPHATQPIEPVRPPANATRTTSPVPAPPPVAVTRATPPPPLAATRAAPPLPPAPAAVSQAPSSAPPPRVPTPIPPFVAPAQPRAILPGPEVAARATPSPRTAAAPLVIAAPSRAVAPATVPAPAVPARTVAIPERPSQAPGAARPAVATVRPATAPPRPQPARARERAPAVPAPFNAVLGTILYSADRRLAIIDGRIVGVGEEVSGARVIDITPSLVRLRDAQGQLRTLTMASAGQ